MNLLHEPQPNHMKRDFPSVFLLLLCGFFLLIGCERDPDPTPDPNLAPTVPSPTAQATETPFPTTSPAATTTPTPTITPTATPLAPRFEGVKFNNVEFLNLQTNKAEVQQPITPSSKTGWQILPQFATFSLSDAPSFDDASSPQIYLYPLRDYAGISSSALIEADNLHQLLKNEIETDSLNSLPFLPLPDDNQEQAFVAQVRRLNHSSGNGMRYLTQYVTEEEAILNNQLFYTYQGITEDGHGYFSLTFPIQTDLLANKAEDLSAADISLLESDYEGYLKQVALSLNLATADQFSPDLDQLDRFIETSYARPPEPLITFDATGKVDLTLVSPTVDDTLLIGRPIYIEGYTQPGTVENVLVTIITGPNRPLQQFVVTDRSGWFRAEIPVPPNAQGPGILKVESKSGNAEVPVSIKRDLSNNGTRYELVGQIELALINPTESHFAVPGYAFFFEGRVSNPIENQITIGLLTNHCQTFIARQSFTVLGGNWFGYIIPPDKVTGSACAVAYTGRYGEGDWREVSIPLELRGDTSAIDPTELIRFGNLSTVELIPGESAYITGSAITDMDNQLELALQTDDGQTIAIGSGRIQQYGFWDIEVGIPAEITGTVKLLAKLAESPQINTQIEMDFAR